jgi:hypothetical protein
MPGIEVRVRRRQRGFLRRLLPLLPVVLATVGNQSLGQGQGGTRDIPDPRADRSVEGAAGAPSPASEQCFRIRNEFGQCVVARLHGQQGGGRTLLVLPDGQLGIPNMLAPTDEPFRPASFDELQAQLHEGPFVEYQLLKTKHYLIFYRSTLAFAQDSGRLLEDLYHGLLDAFRRNDVLVHESEFPLVAVIFATERDFRAHKRVDPNVQAYYEYFTNRIFFFQRSKLDHLEPKITALLKPQTVAHEGAHQILANIGVQPRLSSWPPWLIEGLAELCASTSNTRKGIMWGGFGAINALNMATLRELADPLTLQVNGPEANPPRPGIPKGASRSESLVRKTELTPTDYAEAWALTHFLAHRSRAEFFKFLRAMSQVPPLAPRTPDDHLAEFRKHFGQDLGKPFDKRVADYIRKLSQKKGYDPLPYYAAVFEQSLGQGVIRRAARVSQSPQVIVQWVEETTMPDGEHPNWQAYTFPTRFRANLAAEQWIRGF